MTSYILYLSICATLVNGLAFSFPQQTSVAGGTTLDSGWTPRPTEAPKFHLGLVRRDDSVYTELWAPDNTCGYVSGSQDFPHTCTDTRRFCAMALPFGIDETGTIGCCDAFSCQIKTACVDYSAYQNNDLCNSSCRDDEMMLRCTETSAPYCHYITFDDVQVTDYSCGSSKFSTYQTAHTSWDGEETFSSQVTWHTVTSLIDSSSSAPSLNPVTTITKLETLTSIGTLATSSVPTSTNRDGLPLAATSDATLPKEKSQKASPPVNAIVGGTIGGVALLALIIASIFVIRKHYYKNNDGSKKDGLILKLTRTFTGKPELDTNQPIPQEIYTPEVEQHKFGDSFTKYHPVPTEAVYEPYRDKGSESEDTKAAGTARLSVLSANWAPTSPTPTYASTEPAIVAEVPGSPVSVSMLRNSMIIQEIYGSPVPPSPSPAEELPGGERPAPPSIRISTPPPEVHLHEDHLSPP